MRFDAGQRFPFGYLVLFKYYEERRGKKYKTWLSIASAPLFAHSARRLRSSPLWEEPRATIVVSVDPRPSARVSAWLRKEVIQAASISGNTIVPAGKCQNGPICCGLVPINSVVTKHQGFAKSFRSAREQAPTVFFARQHRNDRRCKATSITGLCRGKMGGRNGLYPGHEGVRTLRRLSVVNAVKSQPPTVPECGSLRQSRSITNSTNRPTSGNSLLSVVRERFAGVPFSPASSCSCFCGIGASAVDCGYDDSILPCSQRVVSAVGGAGAKP